jgi:hypothetical protein
MRVCGFNRSKEMQLPGEATSRQRRIQRLRIERIVYRVSRCNRDRLPRS